MVVLGPLILIIGAPFLTSSAPTKTPSTIGSYTSTHNVGVLPKSDFTQTIFLVLFDNSIKPVADNCKNPVTRTAPDPPYSHACRLIERCLVDERRQSRILTAADAIISKFVPCCQWPIPVAYRMNASLVNTGLWEAFSDVNYALAVISKANAIYTVDAVPKNKALIGVSVPPQPGALRARHASSVGAVPLTPHTPSTVFADVCCMESPGRHEIQWALLTLIAIDEAVRESIAGASPPAAANLTRTLPERFERYLIGSKDGTPAKTPHEAICDWTIRVEMVYKSVATSP